MPQPQPVRQPRSMWSTPITPLPKAGTPIFYHKAPREHVQATAAQCHPPPTNRTISTASPARSQVDGHAWRRTICRFFSTATASSSSPRFPTRSRTETGTETSHGSPFRVMDCGPADTGAIIHESR